VRLFFAKRAENGQKKHTNNGRVTSEFPDYGRFKAILAKIGGYSDLP
jgi:hypothetical protein